MKRQSLSLAVRRLLALCLLLCCMALSCAAAKSADMAVYDLKQTIGSDQLTITVRDKKGSKIKPKKGDVAAADGSILKTKALYANAAQFRISFSAAENGADYLVAVLKDNHWNSDGIYYIDQVTAKDSALVLDVFPKTLTAGQYSLLICEGNSETENWNSSTPAASFFCGSVVKLTKTSLSKAKGGKGQITVQWKKNTSGKGYEIQYSTDKKFKKNNKTVKIKKNGTVKTTIKKLKKGTYYVRICTVSGKDASDWSKSKTVKVK